MRNPAERETHGQLEHSGEDGEGGLRASHKMFWDDGHEGRLRDDASQRAEEAERRLEKNRTDEKREKGNDDVAERHAGHRGDIKRQTKALRELAGDESADDGADGPAGLDEAEAARAGVENVVSQRHEDDVGTNNAGHKKSMGDAEGEDDGLLAEITETFLHVGINGQ